METFVEVLLHNLMQLLPFTIIFSFQRAARWRFGKSPRELKPGIHWKLWIIHNVETLAVTDDVMELPIQSVITQDRKLVCFSVNIGFRIVDIVAHFDNVTDFHEATKALAMTHLAKRVREKKYDEIVNDLSKLEDSLEKTLTTRFKKWGTEVYSLGFTNFAEVPAQVRIFSGGTVLHDV